MCNLLHTDRNSTKPLRSCLVLLQEKYLQFKEKEKIFVMLPK